MKVTYLVANSAGKLQWPDSREEADYRSMGSADAVTSAASAAVSSASATPSAVTIGVFDGVHRGHQAVLRRTFDRAKAIGGRSIAIFFDIRPAIVLRYAEQHGGAQLSAEQAGAIAFDTALTSVRQRLELLQNLGIDEAIVIHYSLAFAHITYDDFIRQLREHLNMRVLVLGQDSRFGYRAEGTVEAVRALAHSAGDFELDVAEQRGPGFVTLDTGNQVRAWSSTNVRALLSSGDVAGVAQILGRHHVVEGEVVHSEQRGRTLGFPTANLPRIAEGFVPADGVYSGWLIDCGPQRGDSIGAGNSDGGSESVERGNGSADHGDGFVHYQNITAWPAAISIGTKLTFADDGVPRAREVETNALADGWLHLYGRHVRVVFLNRLRGQKKFDSVDALVAQMKADAQEARRQCAAAEINRV